MYEFIKEKEIEKIVLEHVINVKKVEDRSTELLKHAFEQITSRILLQVKLHIENSNQFKSIEKIYTDTQAFKERYKSYLENDYHEDIPTENEKDILSGVYKSVRSALEDFPEHDENPLEYERMLIVTTGLLKIKENMNNIQEEVVDSFELPSSLQMDFSELLNSHMISQYESLFSKLSHLVDSIIMELNDASQRIELKNYVSFLENQEIMLKNFIHINLEIGKNWQEQAESSELSAKYIYPLRQLYQDIHTTISDVKHAIKKKYEIKPLEIKNVDKIIESNILRDKRLKELVEIIEDDKSNTVDRIILHINDELTKISTTELKKLRKESNRFELLSCIILEIFEDCLHCISSFEVDKIENDIHLRIVKGVTDTLHLKYDSLKDKDAHFHLIKKQSYLEYGEAFIDFKNQFEQKCDVYLDEAINGSNASFVLAQGKFIRLVDKQSEENLNVDLDYFKKDVLFELRTLEDLIHQSIDKLKESEEEICLNFVECVDSLYHTILNHLKRNDIMTIYPKQHDAFNGKIHEIILAEEEDGFSKGEIIRTQNSGFIYENRILVRASVIAAK